MKHVVVIGAGFGGISAAAYLAQAGYKVTVYEKNSWVGGRARVLERDGFRFDMGPSWYWMPDEHDRWFTDMGVRREDYYAIRRVDPSYKVYYGDSLPEESRNQITVPADFARAQAVFEAYEPGAGERLARFVEQAKQKYEFAMSGFIYRNFDSPFDMVNGTLLKNLLRIDLLRSYRSLINRSFSHPYLRKILEFPVVFLGSFAAKTPAVYTLMNYIDFGLGTWYPEGGFGRVVEAMKEVAESKGARFVFDTEVTRIRTEGRAAHALDLRGAGESKALANAIVANADYVHVESELLDLAHRSVSPESWNRRTFAPAVLNYYVGFNRKLDRLAHHTFFFDTDWDDHFDAVYGKRRWPDDPLFYLHIPSMTDPSCAPEGHEAMFILVPCALGLDDGEQIREHYFDRVMERMERLSGEKLRDAMVFRQTMSISEFRRDYNAHEGTAFGLGQTLFQTAYFRPMNRSKKVRNLYFAGQYTVPGTGTTMSMISGKLAAMRIEKEQPLD
ncbi:MAG: phytoene desaturase [Spirochaetaceae bacterium]|nr:MAG: phytoene desaturase [Spirochaetaceae bacterium]